MKPMAQYNWDIARNKRLQKERLGMIVFGVPAAIMMILFVGSVDSIVEVFLQYIGL